MITNISQVLAEALQFVQAENQKCEICGKKASGPALKIMFDTGIPFVGKQGGVIFPACWVALVERSLDLLGVSAQTMGVLKGATH